jgi:hypothetical protein
MTGLTRHLFFANLSQRFAVDAQIGCRTRFQTANTNFYAA